MTYLAFPTQMGRFHTKSLLVLLQNFRTFGWAEEYKYPTMVLDQMK